MIRLSPKLFEECIKFGKNYCEHLKRDAGARTYTIGEIDKIRSEARKGKVAECVFAMTFDRDPWKEILFQIGQADAGHDIVIAGRQKIDVKQVDYFDRNLIYHLKKWQTPGYFDRQDVHMFAAVCTEEDCGEWTAGWISKPEFKRRCKISPGGPGQLWKGTPFVPLDQLHRPGVFPGRSDDPREHYCWCGEWGSFGNSRGEWHCREHAGV